MMTNPGSSNPSYTNDGAKEAARQEADRVRHQASGAAKDVAATAQHEAGNVKNEAVNQFKTLADSAKHEAWSQASTQKQKLAEQTRVVSDDLQKVARGEQVENGLVQQAIQAAAERAERLTHDLENKEPEDLLDDLRRFAARRPGTFLAIAAGIGLVAGRLTRGMRDGDNESQQFTGGYRYGGTAGYGGTYSSTTGYGAAYGDVEAGTGVGGRPLPTGDTPSVGTHGYEDVTRGSSYPGTQPGSSYPGTQPGSVPGEARGIVDPGERP